MSLTAWYPLQASNPSRVYDFSGWQRHATTSGSLTQKPTPLGAMGLNNNGGANSFLTPTLASGYPCTIAAWVVANSTSSGYRNVVRSNSGGGGSNQSLAIYHWPDNHWRLYIDPSTIDGGAVTRGLIYHLVGTQTDSPSALAKFYVNGVYKGQVADYNPIVQAFQCFDDFHAQRLDGTIQDIRFYNRALTDAEVFALYDPATRWDLYAPVARRTYVFLHGGASIVSLTKGSFGYTGRGAATNARENVGVTKGGLGFGGQNLTVNAREVLAVAKAAFSWTGQAATAVVQSAQTVLVAASRFAWSGASLLVPGVVAHAFTWLPWIRTRDRVRSPTTVPKD
jgi:hypothetical protein